MVAFGRLFEEHEVRVEFLLRGKRGAVDALQHRVVLVAAPIGTGDRHQFEGADLARRMGVTSAAEIGEIADRVKGNRLAFGDLARDFDFVRVTFEVRDRFFARGLPPGHRIVGGDDLFHATLEPTEVFGRERFGAIEVVVEAGFDRRADRRLRFRKEILNRIRQHVRGGVAQCVERQSVVRSAGGSHECLRLAAWQSRAFA